jgi:UDP-N-acetylglucosamine 3-dehydrogenase
MSGTKSRNSLVRIGILGIGWMESVHAGCYQRIEGASVAGVFSRNREQAEAVAKICGAKTVVDASALLDDPGIDAIDVCVPSENHEEFVVAALQRGKHVFCETPFALQLTAADAMLDAAKQSGRLFMVGLLERSIVQYEYVHRVALGGQLGKLLSITTYRLGSYLRSEDSRRHYANPTLELMGLDFDFIRWLIETPASVCATAVETESGVPGEVCAVLTCDSGSVATVTGSGIMPNGFPFSIGFRVLFEKGAFELKTVFEGAGPPKNTFQFYPDSGGSETLAIVEHDPYEHELRYFVDSIRGKADPGLLDAQHAYEALKMSLATLRSVKECRVIRLTANPS